LARQICYAIPKYIFDTTTTPQHVQNIAKDAKSALESSSNQREIKSLNNRVTFFQDASKKVLKNKNVILGIGGMAALGLFASRYSSGIEEIPQNVFGKGV
jgi:hypothetical protein